jgi:hypothetical protein
MTERGLDLAPEESAERGWWYRLSSSAVLVGAGIGWTSAVVACCVAAPFTLAFGADTDRGADAGDDL